MNLLITCRMMFTFECSTTTHQRRSTLFKPIITTLHPLLSTLLSLTFSAVVVSLQNNEEMN